MLHAAFLRSDYAHARIKSIDVSAATETPGRGRGLHRRRFGRFLETRPAAGAPAHGDPGVVFNARTLIPMAKDKVRHSG